ncbi:trypsin-like serine protease [Streptomyces sp. G-G2]|uniref:trypsin-like serine peptidase n=1 Tax=Streptomyces sp. G-G2 TaxID=3046201 RepID=UPI0024BA7CB4|nr:trypsin-like serine protease [Streptomyces sp. G-G2]
MDKRTVVTAVLCSVAALGASAAMTAVVPTPDSRPPAHAKAAPTARPSSTPSSRSQPSGQTSGRVPQSRQSPLATPSPSAPGATPGPGGSGSGTPTAIAGALFTGGLDGDHFCTATVVHSAGRNMIVTAGHCLVAGEQGDAGAVFAPAYANGTAPYGTWKIEKVFEDPRWSDDNDDAFDLAFARLAPDAAGRRIEDVTGAAALDTSGRAAEEVTVTGYPADRKVPRTCTAVTIRDSDTEQRFDCADFPGGTSGSAWVGRDGKIIGVLTGGDTDDVSTSTVFGDWASILYAKSTAPSA